MKYNNIYNDNGVKIRVKYDSDRCNDMLRKKESKRNMIYIVIILLAITIVVAIFIMFVMNDVRNDNNDKENVIVYNTSHSGETKALDKADTYVVAKQPITPQPTQVATPTPLPRHGYSESIPQEIQAYMMGLSYKENNNISINELSYLTIPYYDFNYNIQYGHMVVNSQIAEEVLDIFAELFDIKYPIERMELVDKYNADDFESIEHNNTSAFNYRESTDGSGNLSKHAYGMAIDINPQINPYVNSDGKGSHQNAREYWNRNINNWTSDIAKAAYIGTDTAIYRIFTKYGWQWGGNWNSYRDYQHFQK